MSSEPLPPLRLFKGHTIHQRSAPFTHRFRYGLGMIDLDIDQLIEADRVSSWFGTQKRRVFWFRSSDHGPHGTADLRAWAEGQFSQAEIDLSQGTIRLLTFPRHLGYKFAPISIWLGFGPDQTLQGILYEVNNTFGETHTYVAAIPAGERHQHITDKTFHVSPFFDVSGSYQFTLRVKMNRLSLMIATYQAGQQTHLASLQGRFVSATSAQFAQLALSRPFSTLGVTLAIHWQALKLWLKGAAYHSKPKQAEVRTTLVTEKMPRLKESRETTV